MDRRLTPANGRVAALELKGKVEAEAFVEGTEAAIGRGVTDLRSEPDGMRDREVLYGEALRVFENNSHWAFVQARKDGYVGYVVSDALIEAYEPTHSICVPATHLLSGPKVQSTNVRALPFGARLRIVGGEGEFYETLDGSFVPRRHLRPLNRPFSDPATVAQLFFGAPYLWGGNTVWGIDCSGLVQAAVIACGLPCPGDSDLQASIGSPASAPYQRGDLIFWKGHVALVIDSEVLIHANAYTMSVSYEPILDAINRIKDQGEGPVIAHRRL